MGTQLNTNVSPYYNDYDPLKNFYEILFKPGLPLQARELTQMQSILQNQISTLAERFLKEGDNIVPGEYGPQNPVPYVRLSSITQGASASDFVGYTLTGVTSGVTAEVILGFDATDTDDITLFVGYNGSGTTGQYNKFIEGETLLSDTPDLYTAQVGLDGVSKPTTSRPCGQGCLFNAAEGSFFVDGYMVRVDKQLIAVDKYSITPTCDIGFIVTESVVNSSEDASLLDNATGSSNFAAPGADRLKITLTLARKEEGVQLPNFITLCTMIQGQPQGRPEDQIKWRWLYDILAKRTYEESGDYIVNQFSITPLSYPNLAEDLQKSPGRKARGLFSPDDDNTYPPVPGSGETSRLTFAEANENFVLEVGAGKAYVQGYRVAYNDSVYLFAKKARTQSYRPDATLSITQGFNISTTHAYGSPDFENIRGVANADALTQITLYRNFTDGFVGEATKSNSEEPINYGNPPWTTYHIITAGSLAGISQTGYTIIYQSGNSAVLTGTTPLKRGDTYGGVKILQSITVKPIPAGVLTPRYFEPQDSIIQADGTLSYNSSQKLGITTSNLFTQVPNVAVANSATDWVVGDIVVGDLSRATGVVEVGTSNVADGVGNLVLSNIDGQFRNGERISQGTGATQKVARIIEPGEAYALYFYTGDSGVTDSSANTDLSSVTTVTASVLGSTLELAVTTDFTASASELRLNETGRTKLFNFPFPAGSELAVERLNLDVVTNTGAKGYAALLAGQLTNTLTKTKSLYADLAGYDEFSVDISSQNRKDTEVVEVAANALFTGKTGNNFIECDNFAGDPSKQLEFGDVITFIDDNGDSISKLVFFATAPVGRTTQRAKSRIYLTTTLQGNLTGKTIQRIRILTRGKNSQNLLFQLPQAVVSTLQSNPQATGIDYEVYREFMAEIDQNSQELTLLIPNVDVSADENNVSAGATESFLSNPDDIMISVIRNLADPTDSDNIVGRQLAINQDYDTGNYLRGLLLQDADTKITMRLSYTNLDNCIVKVLIPLKIRNGVAKKKVLREKTVEITADQANNAIIPLGVTDLAGFISCVDTVTDLELVGNYIVDTGQRDNVYDIARIILKDNAPIATNPLKIEIQYYEHVGAGDFFSVDSYTHADGVPYEDIPIYSPQATIPAESALTPSIYINLRDAIDFRPSVNVKSDSTGDEPSLLSVVVSTANGYSENLCTQGTANGSRLSDTNFRGGINAGNAFVPSFPMANSRFECNIQYYTPRRDSLFLDASGRYRYIEGVPSDNPQPPPALATAIRLYDFLIPPYTFKVNNINVKKYNYKRYRMKDIAKIERRVDRVEQLVTLSILEQSALNMSVRDAVTGLDRFKNGIVVDNFRDHGKGNFGQPQYRNSVDPKLTHLRSACWVDQAELMEQDNIRTDRVNQGYAQNRGIAMMNHTSVPFITQPFATRFINLQVYYIFTWDGDLTLYPSIDTWQDVNTLPELVIEDNQLYNAMVNLTGFLEEAGVGTVWSDWEDTGATSTTVNTVTEEIGAATATELSRELTGANQWRTGQLTAIRQDIWTIETLQRGASTQTTETTTTSTEQARQQTTTFFDVGTGQIQETSYGERLTDVALSKTMRTRPVFFVIKRVKPNTEYFCFFDSVNITAWVNPYQIRSGELFPDGLGRFEEVAASGAEITTAPGLERQKGFGEPIMSDANGTIMGMFLVPNGYAPVKGSKFNGDMTEVQYNLSGVQRSFNTGSRQVRFTTSKNDAQDLALVEGLAQTDYTASGVILDKQETMVATRMAEFNFTQRITDSQQRTVEESQITDIQVDIGRLEIVETTEIGEERVVRVDPIGQTFHVENEFREGVFATDLEVYFQRVDAREGVMAYMVTTDGFLTTNEIMPNSKIVLNRHTNLKTVVTLPAANANTSVTLPAGSTITGLTTGATGTTLSDMVFNSVAANADRNVTNTIYNVLLENYVGDFTGETGFTAIPNALASVSDEATSGISSTTFTIAPNELTITELRLTAFGTGYSQPDTTVDGETPTTVTIGPPDMLEGEQAEGVVKVSAPNMPLNGTATGDGLVYEIQLTNPGRGYSKAPSVTINGDGTGATAFARMGDGELAIDMGVCYSEDATAGTKFRFPSPVYLMPDTYYGFVVHAPASLNYEMYTAKVGENVLGTDTRMTEQPNLGSLVKSQDGGLWTEDQTQDVKFILRRANFDVGQQATVTLHDAPQSWRIINIADPIETNNTAAASDQDLAFGSNPRIVRVTSPHHGLVGGDYVALKGIVGYQGANTVGGIPITELNTLHMVVDAGIDTFTIRVAGTGATGSVSGGGDGVYNTPNMPYEVTKVESGAMVFGSSTFLASSRSTQAEAVTGFNRAGAYTLDNETAIALLDSYYYNGPKQVCNYLNQIKNKDVFHLNGERSYELKVRMNTTNAAMSPVLDLTRTNLTTIRNLIDNPSPDDAIYGDQITTVTLNDVDVSAITAAAGESFTFSNTVGDVTTSRTAKIKEFNATTKRLVFQGQFAKEFIKSSTIADTNISAVGAFDVNTSEGNYFRPETSNQGSTYAKWESRLFQFENPCDGMELKATVCLYGNIVDNQLLADNVRAYFKPRNIGFDSELNTSNWVPFNPSFNIPGTPNNVEDIVPRSTADVDPRRIKLGAWQDLTWSVQDIPKFDAVAIKLVMVSDNPALAPVIDDFRLIATE